MCLWNTLSGNLKILRCSSEKSESLASFHLSSLQDKGKFIKSSAVGTKGIFSKNDTLMNLIEMK